jgi:hypothetical protein
MKDVDSKKSSWTTFVVSARSGQKSWEAPLFMCWPKFLTATSRLLPSELRSHATPMTNIRTQIWTCHEIKYRADDFQKASHVSKSQRDVATCNSMARWCFTYQVVMVLNTSSLSEPVRPVVDYQSKYPSKTGSGTRISCICVVFFLYLPLPRHEPYIPVVGVHHDRYITPH